MGKNENKPQTLTPAAGTTDPRQNLSEVIKAWREQGATIATEIETEIDNLKATLKARAKDYRDLTGKEVKYFYVGNPPVTSNESPAANGEPNKASQPWALNQFTDGLPHRLGEIVTLAENAGFSNITSVRTMVSQTLVEKGLLSKVEGETATYVITEKGKALQLEQAKQ